MRNLFLFVFLVLTWCGGVVSAEQVLPVDLHGMPVLIMIPSPKDVNVADCGTGVYLSFSNRIFLVTAAHCIFNIFSTNTTELINSRAIISSFNVKGDPSTKYSLLLDLNRLKQQGLIKRHATHDLAAIWLATMKHPFTNETVVNVPVDGVQGLVPPKAFWETWPPDSLCTMTNVSDGAEVYILGYPVELFQNGSKLPVAVDFDSPLIRKGIVSQKNQKTGKLIIDSGVYGGNSGGPVLVVDHPALGVTSFKIAGLITQFVPYETRVAPEAGITNSDMVNSGYGVAEPIDYALELMRSFSN